MLILRIRQAEVALADGRLDEAVELAGDQRVREHRRGQDLVGQLVRALVERGRAHHAGGRFTEALADCEKAAKLGGSMPEIVALRADAAEALLDQRKAERDSARRLAAAKRWIDRGQLTLVSDMLASSDDSQAAWMQDDLQTRRKAIESILAACAAALDGGDVETAMHHYARAADIGSDHRITEMCSRLVRTLIDRCDEALCDGRIDRASALSQRLTELNGDALDAQQTLRTIAQCQTAWHDIARGRPRDAEATLRRLQALYPKARWIGDVLVQLRQAADAIDQLRAGPLGSLWDVQMDSTLPPSPGTPGEGGGEGRAREAQLAKSPHPNPSTSHEYMGSQEYREREQGLRKRGQIPDRFILHIDGVGSFMVLRRGMVSIGSISSDARPDLGLIAEPSLPAAVIERVEEDYFIRGGGSLQINGRPMPEKLLSSGDRIALSPRCRMTFRLPSGASTSALLELDGARLPRGDVRHVILLDRELIIGPGSSAHVRVDSLEQPIVLHVRRDELICGREKLALGQHVSIGNVSLVVTAADAGR